MRKRGFDTVVVSLELDAALRLLARLGWRIDDYEVRDPYRSDRRYRVTSSHELAKAVERAVADLRHDRPEVPT